MKMRNTVVALSVLLSAAWGCDRGSEQAQLEEEKREAEAKASAAQREADEAKAKAEKEVAEAERKGEESRREDSAEIEKDVAALDRKAATLKESSAKSVGKARLNSDAAIVEFDKRRAVVDADVQRLKTATGAAWDTTKAETQRHIEAAREALDNVDRTVSAK